MKAFTLVCGSFASSLLGVFVPAVGLEHVVAREAGERLCPDNAVAGPGCTARIRWASGI